MVADQKPALSFPTVLTPACISSVYLGGGGSKYCVKPGFAYYVNALSQVGPYFRKRKLIRSTENRGTAKLVREIIDTGFFAQVRYEAMDTTAVAGVQVLPQPMSHRYTDYAGAEHILKVLKTGSLKSKQGVLAAWGAVWKDLDRLIESRKAAKIWVQKTNITSRSKLNPQEYWTKLVQSRFVICPTGGAIQSPKVAEAILAMTIPITYREVAYTQLARIGYPIINVDSWDDITHSRLEMWWAQLSPRLERARWMLLVGIWSAYVTSPCPNVNISDFLDGIQHGCV